MSTHSLICSSNSVLEMAAERKEFNNDQYLGAFGPSPRASLAFIVVVDSRDMCEMRAVRSGVTRSLLLRHPSASTSMTMT